MQLIEINSFVPHIERAPHKVYVIEFTLEELQHFKLAPKFVLKRLEPFTNIDDRTNISVDGLDGDKGSHGHENVTKTHGIVMDFRPLAIKVVYWEKPTMSEASFRTLTKTTDMAPIRAIRKAE